jgi:Fe2+ transport system protein FeoA
MTLANAKIGQTFRLVAIDGGAQLRRRLADLGLNTGMTVEVVNSIKAGPMILSVKDSRLAIGRGMAEKIIVEKV